ncbi:gamma-tubulin complex component protein [Sporodiniella umbellata]|nr:gamma-tubulin complex component protein [Sporodiniella umbellata]
MKCIDMTDPPALQLAKVKSSYKRDVSESDILRDLVFIFQGIDGQYLKADESTQEYFFDTHFMHLSTANEQLTYQLTATGWLYRQVKQFIDKNQLNDGMGLVGQSLCAAVQEELTAYYKWIAILEAQVEKQTARGTMNDQSLTLKRLLVWMEDANNKLSLMRVLTEACEDQKGGALISTLHNYTRHGDPLFKGFVSHLLQVVSKPFYDMLHRWVYEGELDDPFEEFFVACDTTVSEEVLWQYKYSIRENMLPSFLSEELAQKIFSIGKSLNFIRYSCHDPMNTYTPSIQNAFKYGETQTVERTIDAIYLDTSRSLIDLLKTKYKLMDHLRALKRYLLLGQGDFIESLMDTLGTKLNQSASTLFRHNLTGVLETTIRSSNAQYEKPEILNRLDVRLLEIQKDDLGWDVFTLDYHVDAPINTVINPSAMAHYLQMFSFLWRLKRVEYTLSSSWKQWKMYRGAQFSEDLHQSQMTIQKMTHFIYQLQHYVLFEVLECSWKKLENAIESDCIDLDSIIESHNDYLNRITEKGFLSGVQETVLADRLNELFDCILDYKTTLDHLYGRSENEKLAETRRHHQEIETLFTSHVFEFLSILKSYHDEDLRSLSTRLDYNSFYFS